jgi:hypothetical protein
MFNDGILGIRFGCDLAQFLQNYNNTSIGIFLLWGHLCTFLQNYNNTSKGPIWLWGWFGLVLRTL